MASLSLLTTLSPFASLDTMPAGTQRSQIARRLSLLLPVLQLLLLQTAGKPQTQALGHAVG